MEYLQAVKSLLEIEQKYDVMSIKYKGVSVWPFLRIYFFDRLASNRAITHNASALRLLLSSLFQYNPLRFFKKYRIWNYSSSTTRKKIGDMYEHHVSGYLHKSPYSLLTVELQSPGTKRIKYNAIPEKNIVSCSWPLALTAFLELLFRPFGCKLEGESVLKEIIVEAGISFDYQKRIGWLIAQKRTTDFFLLIGHMPELMIMECYYTQMGRIWSAHNHKIPVVELQHGVLNKNHYAYNPTYHSDLLYPDEICVYGEEEYNYFIEKETQFTNKVTVTGLYLLDRTLSVFTEDIFKGERKQYKSIAVVAGQSGGEEQLSAFIDDVSKELNDVYFVYIPRHVIELKFSSPNVQLRTGVNIYEYLKWCDYHITISSTTGLEAHFYKKPVIFCDFNGVASNYYREVISEKNGAFYVHSKEEFIALLPTINPEYYTYRELFAHNSEKNMRRVLDKYLNKLNDTNGTE